jgi:hypothetical protein
VYSQELFLKLITASVEYHCETAVQAVGIENMVNEMGTGVIHNAVHTVLRVINFT